MLHRKPQYEQKLGNPVIVLDSDEVKWLFGIDDKILEKWIERRILLPALTSERKRLFWRKDVTDLLVAVGS